MSKCSDIGSLLRKLLKERSISMRKLSKLTDIDTATISRIISGKRKANLQHLEKIAEHLHVPLGVLVEAAGYSINTEKKLPSDVETSIDFIQTFLQSSDMNDHTFSLDCVDKKLNDYHQYAATKEGEATILGEFEEKIQKIDSIGPVINRLKELYERFRSRKGTSHELALIGGALLYFIIPVDVIPDYLFPVGYLDDAVAVQMVLGFLKTGD